MPNGPGARKPVRQAKAVQQGKRGNSIHRGRSPRFQRVRSHDLTAGAYAARRAAVNAQGSVLRMPEVLLPLAIARADSTYV